MSGKSPYVLAALVSMCLMAFAPGCGVSGKEKAQVPEHVPVPEKAVGEQDALEEQMKAENEEEARHSASMICDVLAEHVFKKQFEEAKKLLEKSKVLIQQVVDEKAAHENPAVGNGYRMWQSGLADVLKILSSTELGEEEKKTKAMMALDRAAQAKRAAAFAEMFE